MNQIYASSKLDIQPNGSHSHSEHTYGYQRQSKALRDLHLPSVPAPQRDIQVHRVCLQKPQLPRVSVVSLELSLD